MDVDKVFTCGFDMRSIRELDILFLECYTEFLFYLSTNSMFIETTEYLTILALKGEGYMLSVEVLLYLECLLETYTGLILTSFFVGFDFLESLYGNFFCYSSRNERITCLWGGDFDNLSLAPEMSDILEKFDIDLASCHKNWWVISILIIWNLF